MDSITQLDKIKTTPWSGGQSPWKLEYGKIMMWIFLISDAFTFSALLVYYGAQRFSKEAWPYPDDVFQSIPGIADSGYPLVFVGIMTFILIVSSLTMVLAVNAGHRGKKKQVIGWMVATIVGGAVFLGCQALEWSHLFDQGFFWGEIPKDLTPYFVGEPSEIAALQFSNLFFTITGFHGFHVFTGLVINIIVLIMTLCGVFERRGTYIMVEKVGLYWHFVDLVWVFVFTFFYLV